MMPPLRPRRDVRPASAKREGFAGGALVGRPGPAGTDDLRRLLKMIADSSDARSELLADLRRRVLSDEYMSEEKLNLAIYRLLKDILD